MLKHYCNTGIFLEFRQISSSIRLWDIPNIIRYLCSVATLNLFGKQHNIQKSLIIVITYTYP